LQHRAASRGMGSKAAHLAAHASPSAESGSDETSSSICERIRIPPPDWCVFKHRWWKGRDGKLSGVFRRA
jgi:hypothetical protein